MEALKIFLTGGTGFLGSAILRNLVALPNVEILALKRYKSKQDNILRLDRCLSWIDIDEQKAYIDKVVGFTPNIIIHAAWSGVTSKERENWGVQLENFELFKDLIVITERIKVDKFIVLGSQSEYGNYAQSVTETYTENAHDAYASCKLSMKSFLEAFCLQQSISWYWLRVFSIYGPGENGSWFIPWIINSQLNNESVELTLCEQKYDYLYVDDFAKMISQIVISSVQKSGIYNICSGKSISLSTIAKQIKEIVGSSAELHFGTIPYRKHQGMYLGGDNSKYKSSFGDIPDIGLEKGLELTVDYYRSRLS